ncbi:MAG: YkvA family protein [Thermodesulfobacteriota bacterium]
MNWKGRVQQLNSEIHAVFLAYQDRRVPWYTKAFLACLMAYALSPLDLIPDFIPILGQADDLILIPLGIALAIRMIPQEVLVECRQRAGACAVGSSPWRWVGVWVVVTVWALMATLTASVTTRTFS